LVYGLRLDWLIIWVRLSQPIQCPKDKGAVNSAPFSFLKVTLVKALASTNLTFFSEALRLNVELDAAEDRADRDHLRSISMKPNKKKQHELGCVRT
jgi:hypothetical protein